MDFFHLHTGIIKRTDGRSAVAHAAYISCSRLCNDYDGLTADYTRKKGLLYSTVMLPDNAPREWKDRAKLWNAVEETETSKDAQLAREIDAALPKELPDDVLVEMVRTFVQNTCVDQGMCADVAIHVDDRNNPHFHLQLTMRPLDENGKWQAKTQKEYICRRAGEAEERKLTAEEFKRAASDGWEKLYAYQNGKDKKSRIYLTPTEAALPVYAGYTRVNKTPKSTRYGRQNPVTEQWNSREQLMLWRKEWEQIVNDYQERFGIAERVDCRSYKKQGIKRQATVHEGAAARNSEHTGAVSDKCELNRVIGEDNREYETALKEYRTIIDLIRSVLTEFAKYMEKIRLNAVRYMYHLLRHERIVADTERQMKEQENSPGEYDRLSGIKERNEISASNWRNRYENAMDEYKAHHRALPKRLRGELVREQMYLRCNPATFDGFLAHQEGVRNNFDADRLIDAEKCVGKELEELELPAGMSFANYHMRRDGFTKTIRERRLEAAKMREQTRTRQEAIAPTTATESADAARTPASQEQTTEKLSLGQIEYLLGGSGRTR